MLAKVLLLLAISFSFVAGQQQGNVIFPNIHFRTQLSVNAKQCLDKIRQSQTAAFQQCVTTVNQSVWNGPNQQVIDRFRACQAISNGLDCVVRLGPNFCTQQNLNELTLWANSMKPTGVNDGSRPVQVRNYTSGGFSTICNRVPLNAFGGIQFLAVNATPGAYSCFQKILRQRNNELNTCNANVQKGVWESNNRIKEGRSVCKTISEGLDCIAKLANKTCTDNYNKTQLLEWAWGNKCTPVYVRNRTAGARNRWALIPCNQSMCQPKQKLDQNTADYVGNVTQLWVYHHLSDKVNRSRCINDTEKQSKYVREYMECIDLAKDDWIKRETNETLDHDKCCLKWSVVGCYLKFIKKACDVSVLKYLDCILREMKIDDCPNVGYVNNCEKKSFNFLV